MIGSVVSGSVRTQIIAHDKEVWCIAAHDTGLGLFSHEIFLQIATVPASITNQFQVP